MDNKEEQISVQFMSFGGKKWKTMKVYTLGRTERQIIKDLNSGEMDLPFHIRCQWRELPKSLIAE